MKKDFYQAARMYMSANNYEKALLAYKYEGKYDEALKIARKLNYDDSKIKELKHEFIEILAGMGKNSVNFQKILFVWEI